MKIFNSVCDGISLKIFDRIRLPNLRIQLKRVLIGYECSAPISYVRPEIAELDDLDLIYYFLFLKKILVYQYDQNLDLEQRCSSASVIIPKNTWENSQLYQPTKFQK